MQTVRKVFAVLLLAAIVGCSWLAPMDSPAMERVDSGLKRALASFATARALNAVISVAQGTEASIQPLGFGVTLTPGQVLDPVNDLIESFSSLMLAASVVFGVQKVLIAIGSYWPVSLALTVVALGWTGFYVRKLRPPPLLSRLLVVFLLLRFAIPVVTLGTDAVWKKYLAADYVVSQSSISSASGQAGELTPPIPGAAESQGLLEKMKGWFSKNPDVKVPFQKLKEAAELATGHVIRLIVIFLLQTLVIPLLLLWVLYGAVRRAVEFPGPTAYPGDHR